MMGMKSDPVWKPDHTGSIRESRVTLATPADTSTDLLLRSAPQRRSLAFELQTREYNMFERWTDTLLEAI